MTFIEWNSCCASETGSTTGRRIRKLMTVNRKFIVIHHYGAIDRVMCLDPCETVIGRRRGCTIFLDDIHVSRKHAIIRIDAETITIEDLESANGTFVNGQPLKELATLKDGDEVSIGPFMLKVCGSLPDPPRNLEDGDISTLVPVNGLRRLKPMPQSLPVLTPAQQRIMNGLLEGHTEKELATRLEISHHTVHTHAKAIYKAYCVSSRGELVARHLALMNQNFAKTQPELDLRDSD